MLCVTSQSSLTKCSANYHPTVCGRLSGTFKRFTHDTWIGFWRRFSPHMIQESHRNFLKIRFRNFGGKQPADERHTINNIKERSIICNPRQQKAESDPSRLFPIRQKCFAKTSEMRDEYLVTSWLHSHRGFSCCSSPLRTDKNVFSILFTLLFTSAAYIHSGRRYMRNPWTRLEL